MPYELNKDKNRPDVCLGTDEFHTSKELVKLAENYLSSKNFTTSVNIPFAGSFVPEKHYLKDKRVKSIMIEISRSLYMDEATGQKLPSFSFLVDIISGFVDTLAVGATKSNS